MDQSLNTLKAGHLGDYIRTIIVVIGGDTRSFDYDSYIPKYPHISLP